MATYEELINSPLTDSGDDVYFKPTDTDFTGGSTWGTSVVAATEIVDTNGFAATLDEAKGYFAYANGTFNAFTADATSDEIIDTAHGLLNGETVKFKGIVYPIKTITVASGDLADNVIRCTAHGYTTGMRIRFFGDGLPAPLVQGTSYYVFLVPDADTFSLLGIGLTAIGSGTVQRFNLPAGITQSTLHYVRDVSTDRFKVSLTAGGSAVNLTDAGSSTMVYVAPSQRSKAADIFLGTVPVRAIPDMIGEGEIAALTDQLDEIQAKTDLIGTGNATVTSPVSLSGSINSPLFIGDDYLSSNGRAFTWTVSIPTATTVAGSSCALKFVKASGECTAFEVVFTGVISAAASGFATLTFSPTDTETATIPPGEYMWFVTWVGDNGEQITKSYSRSIVHWKAKEAA